MIHRTLSWSGVSSDGKTRWVAVKASDIIGVEDCPEDKAVTIMLSHGRAIIVFTESDQAAKDITNARGWPEGIYPTAPEVAIALEEWLWGWPFCHCWSERNLSINWLVSAIGKFRLANVERARELAARKRFEHGGR